MSNSFKVLVPNEIVELLRELHGSDETDEIVEQLIALYKTGVSTEGLKSMTENYLAMLKLSGDEKGYEELIPLN